MIGGKGSKRLKIITLEQVNLGDLTLMHFKTSKGGTLTDISGGEETQEIDPITDNGLREDCERKKNTYPI